MELIFKEIGKTLDLTESRICQIHAMALIKLKSRLQKYYEEDNFSQQAAKKKSKVKKKKSKSQMIPAKQKNQRVYVKIG